jgi:hypothetical protein
MFTYIRTLRVQIVLPTQPPICACTYVCIPADTCIHTCPSGPQTHPSTHTCRGMPDVLPNTNTHTFSHVRMYAYTHMCRRTCTHRHTYTWVQQHLACEATAPARVSCAASEWNRVRANCAVARQAQLAPKICVPVTSKHPCKVKTTRR